MSSERPPNVFVMSAPSGAGKSTILRALLSSITRLRFSVSHTTRPPRAGEEDGRDYHFVSADAFQELIHRHRLLEWATVHGNYYGTSFAELEKATEAGEDLLLDVDVQGAGQVRQRIHGVVSVFILPPSYEVLEARLRSRGQDDPESMEKRLRRATEEVSHYHEFDYVLVNDDLELCVSAFRSVIEAARNRVARQDRRARSILESFLRKQGQ